MVGGSVGKWSVGWWVSGQWVSGLLVDGSVVGGFNKTHATEEFGNRCFFKDMNFYGLEFLRTVPDICFRITFISDSENHRSHDSFSFIFSMSAKLFLWLWGVAFWNFQEITIKKQRDVVYVSLDRRSQELRRFFRNFQEFPEQIISRAYCERLLLSFLIFSF